MFPLLKLGLNQDVLGRRRDVLAFIINIGALRVFPKPNFTRQTRYQITIQIKYLQQFTRTLTSQFTHYSLSKSSKKPEVFRLFKM